MTAWRLRRSSLLLGIIGSLFYPLLIQSSSTPVNSPGEQFIAQYCAEEPRRRRVVRVRSVSLLCDSQNQGNDNDQDKATCRSGDLAKIAVLFDVYKRDEDTQIHLDLKSSAFGTTQYIHNNTSICDLGTLAYWGDDDMGDDYYAAARARSCSLENGGPYSIFTSFSIPYFQKNSDYKFTPDLRIDFYDNNRHQVGCVETGSLAEVSFGKGMERTGQRFFVISFLLVCISSACCIVGQRQRRKQVKQAFVKRQASALRRFHYIRTTRSGETNISREGSLKTSRSRTPSIPENESYEPPAISIT